MSTTTTPATFTVMIPSRSSGTFQALLVPECYQRDVTRLLVAIEWGRVHHASGNHFASQRELQAAAQEAKQIAAALEQAADAAGQLAQAQVAA